VTTAVEEGVGQNIPSLAPRPRWAKCRNSQQGSEAPRIISLFRLAQIYAVQAPCCGNIPATWRVLAPRQLRLIAPLSSGQGRDELGVPAVRRMCGIDLPRLEGNPAVEVFARNRTGPSKGIHRAAGVLSDGVCLNALLAGSSRLKWGVCNAMARMDSLECLGYGDLVNFLVSNRSICTS
jgi:hypothetical protein